MVFFLSIGLLLGCLMGCIDVNFKQPMLGSKRLGELFVSTFEMVEVIHVKSWNMSMNYTT